MSYPSQLSVFNHIHVHVCTVHVKASIVRGHVSILHYSDCKARSLISIGGLLKHS